jgi:superfamily II DNA or RNA helicase
MKANETYDLPSNWKTRGWQESCLAAFRKRHRLAKLSYFTFLISAGVGSGKTIMSALIAAYLLNKGDIDRIVYVCPTRVIRKEVIKVYADLNIALVKWNSKKHRDGEPPGCNGVILTYSKLIHDHELMGQLCNEVRTLVIFDEIHHLGDRLSWGSSAESAFKFRAACILGLSGTPFRSDNRPIPFVEYELSESGGLKVFRADYTYTLGRSVLDGVCRRPVFHWLEGDVRITLDDHSKSVVNWDQKLAIHLANRRLNAAVRHGSKARTKALRKVIEFCRRTNRKLIIFVGGDSNHQDGGGIRDATEFLPAELRLLGVRDRDMCSVVSDDDLAHDKISAFGKSEAWILIAVNMVSEGADIPELCVELFLTSITANATTIQRIGRALRGEGEAHIYMFKDKRYMDIAELVEIEINHEIDLGKAAQASPDTRGPSSPRSEADPEDIGLTCVEGGETINSVYYPPQVRIKYFQVIAEEGLPEGYAFRSVLYPLILKGKYGPITGMETGVTLP